MAGRIRTWAMFLILFAVTAAADSKPVVTQRTCLILAPSDLRDLWNDSAVIARVRITESDGIGIGGDPRFLPIVRTEHTATVLNTYKGELGAQARFLQVAGSLELEDKIIQVEDHTPLPADTEYIVFLRRDPHGRYHLVYDVEGVFKVEEGAIDPQGRGKCAVANRGVSVRQFIDAIDYVSRSRDARK